MHVRTWRAAYEHVFGSERLAAIDLGEREERWRQRLAEPEPAHTVLVAEEGGSIVGFAACGESRDAKGEAELYGIYVLPKSWGMGAGPALMRAVLERLRIDGFSTATLWVLEDNPRARRFYEREGWSVDGSRQGEHLGVRTSEIRYRITLG